MTMNPMKHLLAVAALICLGTLHAVARPNVIVIMADDQGYGDIKAHGHPFIRTPNMDKLHAESVRFTDLHLSPMCTPTHRETIQYLSK
jgi:arylsulfatase A-like enzyme